MSVAEQAQRLGKKIEDYVMALPSWAQEIVDEIGRTNPLGEREKEEASSLLGGLESKLPFATNSLQVVTKRYLIKNLDGKILETPEQMFYRVARNIALHESEYGASQETIDALTKEYFFQLANLKFTPAGRSLANVGAPTALVANCIVLHIEDSMEGIFKTLMDAALLQKAGSGLGFPLHLMRPAGEVTKTSFGSASGPVYNTAFGVIKQQNRHGANMAVMRVDHPDILEFLHCKDKEGAIANFNVSVGLTDEFMKQVEANDPRPWKCRFKGTEYPLRRIERTANYSVASIQEVKMTARELFDEIVDGAWRMGEPGCVFLDTVNKTNPVPGLGPIEACNPCGEQFLHDGDVCNLGSINLEKFVTPDRKVDVEGLKHTVRLAVRFLDNIIDLSNFPVERVNCARLANRRIGLGIMGFADMLYQMKIGYDTPRGREIAGEVMGLIRSEGHNMSVQLGKEKGNFPNYHLSIFKDSGEPRRNAAITNIAPTGTISMMHNVSGGVEPYFALAYYYKAILGGNVQLSCVNKHLRNALEEKGIYSDELMDKIIKKGSLQKIRAIPKEIKDVFVTSMDISADNHIAMQAAMQQHCENAISKTINFPNKATHEEVFQGYLKAWSHGCKGCTVYRDGSRFLQVLNLNEDDDEEEEDETMETEPEQKVEEEKKVEQEQDAKMSLVVSSGEKRKALEADLEECSRIPEVEKRKKRVSIAPFCSVCSINMTPMEGCYTCLQCGNSLCSK